MHFHFHHDNKLSIIRDSMAGVCHKLQYANSRLSDFLLFRPIVLLSLLINVLNFTPRFQLLVNNLSLGMSLY